MSTSPIHHRKLPAHWALIAGAYPPDEFGFKSDNLQIVYNYTDQQWSDDAPHAHEASEEIYIVIKGTMTVEVDGTSIDVRAGEVLCVAAGTAHQLVSVTTPIESFVVRAPALKDKVIYKK